MRDTIIIRQRISSAKSQSLRNFTHLIFDENPDPNSMAGYVLLKRHFELLDPSRCINIDWRYYFIARRTFLRRKKKEHGGHWECHYCGKIITNNSGKQKNFVTVDHKMPKTKILDPTDSTNFVESCSSCNTKKGSMDYADFMHRIGKEIPKELTKINTWDYFMSKLLVILKYIKKKIS